MSVSLLVWSKGGARLITGDSAGHVKLKYSKRSRKTKVN